MALHCAGRVSSSCGNCFSPTADSDGVCVEMGCGVVWGNFHKNSARVLQKLRGFREGARFIGRFQGGFQESSARVLEGVALLGISPELIFFPVSLCICKVTQPNNRMRCFHGKLCGACRS